ncbi:MAG: MBL fold metallo-hydrolase [Candidatus Bathyarchaeia archaeon]
MFEVFKMHILFLGTGAAEGWPAIFCRCDACARARALGGRNLRSRSSIHINGAYKVDWPPDTYLHMLRYNLNFADIKYLFITHGHYDHLHSDDLFMRRPPFAHMRDGGDLHVYGSREVIGYITRSVGEQSNLGLILHDLRPFETVKAGEFKVTALLADHDPNQTCFLYLFESGGKVFLHGYDSGWFPEETWRALEGYRLNLAVLDCTMGAASSMKYHMGLKEVIEVKRKMVLKGIADRDTIFIATHFSHNGLLLHDELTAKLLPEGIEVAYDGLSIEI